MAFRSPWGILRVVRRRASDIWSRASRAGGKEGKSAAVGKAIVPVKLPRAVQSIVELRVKIPGPPVIEEVCTLEAEIEIAIVLIHVSIPGKGRRDAARPASIEQEMAVVLHHCHADDIGERIELPAELPPL